MNTGEKSGLGLSGSRRKFLRGKAHHLDAIVSVGAAGCTPAVEAAVDQALLDHELIKVRFHEQKTERGNIATQLADKSGAELVGMIGKVAILFRPHPDPEKRGFQQ